MRGLARALCLGVITIFCALPAAAASGALPNNENVVPSGSLTYTWHGDPARGCVAAGVCDVQGELILRPLGDGQVSVFGRSHAADINLDVSGVVRVLRGGAAPGECVDNPSTVPGLDIRFLTATRAVLNAPADSGRCAGPLESDLANMPIPVRQSGENRASFDLRGSRSFVAGPFTGSLVSTMALQPTATQGFSSNQRSGFGSSSAPSHVVLEQAQVSYRVTGGSNEIQTTFSGAKDSSCQIFDACGARGSLALLVSRPATFTIQASRLVHARRSRRRVLADLRHGRLTVNGEASVAGYVNEGYEWGDGSSCRDSVSLPAPQLQLILGAPGPGPSPGRIPASLLGGSGPNLELLRTHCPGPAESDLISQNGILATGSVSAGELLDKHLTVTLTESSAFTGLGYTGSRSGSIQLELTLTKVHADATRAP